MDDNFSNNRSEIKIFDQNIFHNDHFQYLESIIHDNREIENDVAYKIQVR